MNGERPDSAAGAIEAAARALGLRSPEAIPLPGGVANRSFRLREGAHDFVLRLAGSAAARLGASSRSEFAMQALAAAAGLAPPIVLADAAHGFIVSRFAPGRVPTAAAMRSPRLLRRVGAWFARLHGLEVPPGLAAIDFGERAADYLARIAARDPGDFIRRLQRELAQRRAGLRQRPPASRPAITTCTGATFSTTARTFSPRLGIRGSGRRGGRSCGLRRLPWARRAALDALLAATAPPAGWLRARIAALAWIFDCLWYGWNGAAAAHGLAPDAGEQSRLAARLLA